MREIVAGVRGTGAGGVQQLNVWFRFSVPVARQPYYAAMNGSYVPQAPDSNGGNTYSSAPDQAEIAAFKNGSWIERPGFYIVIDPTETTAQIGTHLVNIYNAAATAVGQQDTAALANYATSYDGTSWTIHSF